LSWKTATISSTSATPPWKMTTLRWTPPKPAANQQDDAYAPDTDPASQDQRLNVSH
jgi:hypothetical protein